MPNLITTYSVCHVQLIFLEELLCFSFPKRKEGGGGVDQGELDRKTGRSGGRGCSLDVMYKRKFLKIKKKCIVV